MWSCSTYGMCMTLFMGMMKSISNTIDGDGVTGASSCRQFLSAGASILRRLLPLTGSSFGSLCYDRLGLVPSCFIRLSNDGLLLKTRNIAAAFVFLQASKLSWSSLYFMNFLLSAQPFFALRGKTSLPLHTITLIEAELLLCPPPPA